MPFLAFESKEEEVDRELIHEIKMVADYCNLSINETLDLPCDLFALSLKKAFVNRLESTDKGREMLKLSRDMERECDLDVLLNFYEEEGED